MALCDCPVGVPIGPTLASTCGGGQFMLFMGLLEVFLRSQCDLEDPCNRPKVNLSTIKTKTSAKYTLIMVLILIFVCRVEHYLKQNMILLLLAAVRVVPLWRQDCPKCHIGEYYLLNQVRFDFVYKIVKWRELFRHRRVVFINYCRLSQLVSHMLFINCKIDNGNDAANKFYWFHPRATESKSWAIFCSNFRWCDQPINLIKSKFMY